MKPFNLEEALSGKPVSKGHGVFGKGIQNIPNAQRDPLYKKAYSRWYNLLQRCYSDNFHKHNPTYSRASICEDWLVFSNFYYWITSFDNWDNLEIDKDLLSGTHYSPETCLLIPKSLNTFLTFSQRTNTNMIGVNYYTPKGRKEGVFRATISVKCKGKPSNRHLGFFSTPLEGHLAWLSAKIEHLDEHISKSNGKVKSVLLALRECMKYHLTHEKEFHGLECFRNTLPRLRTYEEPTKSQDKILEEAWQNKGKVVKTDAGMTTVVEVVGKTSDGEYIVRNPVTGSLDEIGTYGKLNWQPCEEPKGPVLHHNLAILHLPKPIKPKEGEDYWRICKAAIGKLYVERARFSHSSYTNRTHSEQGNCFKSESDAQAWIHALNYARTGEVTIC